MLRAYVVRGLIVPVILGVDWLAEQDARIECRERIIKMCGIPAIHCDLGPARPQTVSLSLKGRIRARTFSVQRIRAGKFNIGEEVLVEPVLVTNPTTKAIRLTRGMCNYKVYALEEKKVIASVGTLDISGKPSGDMNVKRDLIRGLNMEPLEESQQRLIRALLTKHLHVCSDGVVTGHTTVLQHPIETGSAVPIALPRCFPKELYNHQLAHGQLPLC